ncbi:MAG: hypothetical protein H0V18_20120 [Pyrinomonadaceae bacterium]|nr:hypothetical protein [Pyrinomonadaceae bacterium]
MKILFLRTLPVLALCGLFFTSTVAAQQHSEPPLTNAAVVKLVRAGFREKTVIAIIRSRPNRFDLDPDRLIDLKRNGVTENIILTMLALDESSLADDDWSDESFFKRKGRAADNGAGDPRGGESEIFGSSGGSKGQTSGRGVGGSNQGETTTTGSATVRIMRPPAEAGGAPLKLEKTPTLTNDSIIQLVEAGFSEGTIIKRIEDSPADFDLSLAKINELRKRRVTDAIITAMTAAMDDSGLKTGGPARSGDN